METKICKCCNTEKPVTEFGKNVWGYTSICKVCTKNHREEYRQRKKKAREEKSLFDEKKKLAIKDFTPRELMNELARRGYEGKLRYVRVEEIDISNF